MKGARVSIIRRRAVLSCVLSLALLASNVAVAATSLKDLLAGKTVALVHVDMQNTFQPLPVGQLPVEGADEIIETINRLTRAAEGLDIPIYFSRDFHKNSATFKSKTNPNGWPPHGRANTEESEFPAELYIPASAHIINKAQYAEAYSAFRRTGLAGMLKGRGVDTVFVTGVATDHCVLHTALDALKSFDTFLVSDATRPVNHDSGLAALATMKGKGVKLVTGNQLARHWIKQRSSRK